MLEYGWAVIRVFGEPEGIALGPAEQSCEPSLALDQRQVAQVVAVMLDQVEGEQFCDSMLGAVWLSAAHCFCC